MTGRWAALGLAVAASTPAPAVERGEVSARAIADHAAQASAVWTQRAQAMASAIDGMLRAELEALTGREEGRSRVAHAPSAGVCESIEGVRGAGAARTLQEEAAASAGRATVAWLLRDTQHAPGMSAASDLRARVDLVLERYCTPGRTATGEGTACGGEWSAHMGDVAPGALFGARTFANGDQALAAADWARNVTMPVPELGVSWGAESTALGRRALLERRADEARAALAAGYLQERVSARLPAVSAAGWARAVSGEEAGDAGGRLSAHALLGVLARGRFERPDGFLRLQAQDTSNLLRELIVSETVSLALSFESYRDEERRSAMRAGRLAAAIERDRRP